MANFLGYHTLNNKPSQKLETIYENPPASKQHVGVEKDFSQIKMTFLCI